MAEITLPWNARPFSKVSASLIKIVSTTPAASPARTSATYTLENKAGCLLMASLKDTPDCTSAMICPTAPLMRGPDCNCSKFNASVIGNPALIIVASCRVKLVTSDGLTRPHSGQFSPFGSLETEITVNFFSRAIPAAFLASGASTTPLTSSPRASRALYLNFMFPFPARRLAPFLN